MRRMVEGGRSGVVLRFAVLTLAFGLESRASGDGDGPELSGPSEMPKASKPPVTARPRPSGAPSSGGRAVLALPGITTPATRTPSVITSTPSTVTAAPSSEPGELTLDGPIEMSGSPRITRPRPVPPASTGRASTVDPLPIDESPALGEPEARTSPSARRPSTASTRPEPLPVSPARRGRLFGLVPGPMAVPPASRSTLPGRSSSDTSDDLAADSALKKRIEKQAREAVGDRARMLEVRVAGKDVSIQARGVRLFQKGAVRKSLESIPALSGLRSSVEVGN